MNILLYRTFSFTGLSSGSYEIDADNSGYQNTSAQTQIVPTGQRITYDINFCLTPLPTLTSAL